MLHKAEVTLRLSTAEKEERVLFMQMRDDDNPYQVRLSRDESWNTTLPGWMDSLEKVIPVLLATGEFEVRIIPASDQGELEPRFFITGGVWTSVKRCLDIFNDLVILLEGPRKPTKELQLVIDQYGDDLEASKVFAEDWAYFDYYVRKGIGEAAQDKDYLYPHVTVRTQPIIENGLGILSDRLSDD